MCSPQRTLPRNATPVGYSSVLPSLQTACPLWFPMRALLSPSILPCLPLGAHSFSFPQSFSPAIFDAVPSWLPSHCPSPICSSFLDGLILRPSCFFVGGHPCLSFLNRLILRPPRFFVGHHPCLLFLNRFISHYCHILHGQSTFFKTLLLAFPPWFMSTHVFSPSKASACGHSCAYIHYNGLMNIYMCSSLYNISNLYACNASDSGFEIHIIASFCAKLIRTIRRWVDIGLATPLMVGFLNGLFSVMLFWPPHILNQYSYSFVGDRISRVSDFHSRLFLLFEFLTVVQICRSRLCFSSLSIWPLANLGNIPHLLKHFWLRC